MTGNIYPIHQKMIGTYTIQTHFLEKNILINSLYTGEKIEEKNEIEIISTRCLDKRIVNIMLEQQKKLLQNPKLNPVVQTISL